MKWFRLYADAVDDSKLKLLAFEDRWHFVAICCLKCSGELDGKGDLRIRRIAAKLGLSLAELDNVKKRLMEVELVDSTLMPCAWNRRQFVSDDASERVRKHREKTKDVKRYRNVSVTPSDSETETDTETEKKPKKSVARFTAPTAQDVAKFVSDNGYIIDPERFIDHYTANGWRVGNTPMKNWQAAVRTWHSREVKTMRNDRRSMIGAPIHLDGEQ